MARLTNERKTKKGIADSGTTGPSSPPNIRQKVGGDREEHHVKIETEIGVMLPQTRDHEPPGEKRQGMSLP